MTCGDKFNKNCPTGGTRITPEEAEGRPLCDHPGCGKRLQRDGTCVAGHAQGAPAPGSFPPRDLGGLSDTEFGDITARATDWQYLTVLAGEMATKSKGEDWLMAQYNLTRDAAHQVMNFVESGPRAFSIGRDGVRWCNYQRPAPTALPPAPTPPRCVVDTCGQTLDEAGHCPRGHLQERPPRSARAMLEVADLYEDAATTPLPQQAAQAAATCFAEIWDRAMEITGVALSLLTDDADTTAVALMEWQHGLLEQLPAIAKKRTPAARLAAMLQLLPRIGSGSISMPWTAALSKAASTLAASWLEQSHPSRDWPALIARDVPQTARTLLAWKRQLLAAIGLTPALVAVVEQGSVQRLRASWLHLAPESLALFAPQADSPDEQSAPNPQDSTLPELPSPPRQRRVDDLR